MWHHKTHLFAVWLGNISLCCLLIWTRPRKRQRKSSKEAIRNFVFSSSWDILFEHSVSERRIWEKSQKEKIFKIKRLLFIIDGNEKITANIFIGYIGILGVKSQRKLRKISNNWTIQWTNALIKGLWYY